MLKIERLCQRLERQVEGVLRALSTWDATTLAFKPDALSWSALEVLSHLHKGEVGLARDLRTSCAAPGEAPPAAEALRAHGLFRWLLSDGRVEVPKSVAGLIWPDEELAFDAVAKDWKRARKVLLQIARKAEPGDGSVFRHPGSGAMTLMHTLRFVYAHTRHHEHQLLRLKDAFGAQQSLPR